MNETNEPPHLAVLIIAFSTVLIGAVYAMGGILKLIFGFTWARFHEVLGVLIPAAMATLVGIGFACLVLYCVYEVFVKPIKK